MKRNIFVTFLLLISSFVAEAVEIGKCNVWATPDLTPHVLHGGLKIEHRKIYSHVEVSTETSPKGHLKVNFFVNVDGKMVWFGTMPEIKGLTAKKRAERFIQEFMAGLTAACLTAKELTMITFDEPLFTGSRVVAITAEENLLGIKPDVASRAKAYCEKSGFPILVSYKHEWVRQHKQYILLKNGKAEPIDSYFSKDRDFETSYGEIKKLTDEDYADVFSKIVCMKEELSPKPEISQDNSDRSKIVEKESGSGSGSPKKSKNKASQQ